MNIQVIIIKFYLTFFNIIKILFELKNLKRCKIINCKINKNLVSLAVILKNR